MIKFKVKSWVRSAAVILGFLGIVLLSIPLFGFAWHLLHGDFLYFQEWKIPVPRGFYVRQTADGPAMWRMALGYPIWHGPYGLISVFNHPTNAPFHFEDHFVRFSNGVAWQAKEEGYTLQSVRTISIANTSGFCLELDRAQGQPKALVRCAIEGSRVSIFYGGDPKFVSEFYRCLQGVTTNNVRSR